MPSLPPKDVVCSCGHTFTIERKKILCIKCGKYVFYNAEEQKKHKMNTAYMVIAVASALGLITYFFIELIAIPLLKF
jgi:hypothetical protein